ncbi:ribosome maturation factor RimM [Belliella kenyensis]|uniref:Ribosome maturation factor RimM n=1 Tax=Belliella kenyensis TaxID=1472724 RepID=A0ABV8ERG5_9BACT|nr:ribosome maturation factor RimM [Belliella kenyensis]MCH7402491.1 ribosome maturation factor RimM [Belliella kenyensis]MDN3603290.1 ribosome maturation factor RimM [Belliella kenyensis]
MNKDKCFQLGYISKVHGLHGEVTVVLDVDYPEAYEGLEHVFIEQKSRLVPFFIEYFEVQPSQKVLAKFEEYNSMDDAEKLVGSQLYLPLTALEELGDDQYYFHELVGFVVEDEKLGVIGTVNFIYDLQTQDLLGVDHKGKEVLIPIQDGIIQKVDKAAKKVYSQLPEGFLEIYLEE